ncbi:MAG TPA: mobile mystery protein B [Chitinophagales bacterium]|nr:mobile mystery protein B [Chitinophagales bacterium]
MGLELDYIFGQTPLDEDEKDALLIDSIVTRGELDEFEQLNIEEAVAWSLGQNFKIEELFTEYFMKHVHKKMFGNVWEWAGKFRKTDKNIGVDKNQITIELKKLIDDTRHWIEHDTYEPDEITIRFKHRLVSIHCFPNGNGRHSRLLADMIVEKIFGREVFSWGAHDLAPAGSTRKKYIDALRAADKGDYTLLIAFSRS